MPRHAAWAYSLIRPFRTGFRWIRSVSGSVAVGRGASRPASGTRWAVPWCGRAELQWTWYSVRTARRCASPRISTRSRSSRRRVPTRRSQVAFMRGAWTAVHRILAPVAWKTASKERVKFDPRVADQELDVFEPLAEAEGEVAGLLHRPLAGGVCGDAAEVHPASAMPGEHQDVQSVQQHGARLQEVDREDPAGLACQQLPPTPPRPATPP